MRLLALVMLGILALSFAAVYGIAAGAAPGWLVLVGLTGVVCVWVGLEECVRYSSDRRTMFREVDTILGLSHGSAGRR